jgi:hypothetical protein
MSSNDKKTGYTMEQALEDLITIYYKGCVTLCTVTLSFTLKKYLEENEELWKFKYFRVQKYNRQKFLYKKPKSFKIS